MSVNYDFYPFHDILSQHEKTERSSKLLIRNVLPVVKFVPVANSC